jgi:hypothetical protein
MTSRQPAYFPLSPFVGGRFRAAGLAESLPEMSAFGGHSAAQRRGGRGSRIKDLPVPA